MIGVEGKFDVVGARGALTYFATLDPARVSHAYLFTGAPGVGKKTFARRLAQSLLCETPKTTVLGYCGHCVGCSLFEAGTHPDFLYHEGSIKIGKDAGSALHDEELTARDLVRELSLHAYRSARRVVVLGDAQFATHEAANALLKFFEEPPSSVVVVLTTSAPGTLLATIRSRFVEIPFQPLDAGTVEAVLVAEGVAARQAVLAAKASLGSITRARAVLGEDEEGLRGAAFEWFAGTLAGEDADQSFLRLDDRSLSAGEKRAIVAEFVDVVRVAARDWAALTLAGKDAPLLAADQRKRLAALPARSPEATLALLAALSEAERLSQTNVSAGLVVDYLRMQLAPA
ncbi:MAG TPA: DNA polymerase III subunit [Candidatus Baltobacteraceae bacterium]|nr:DNA polymerase III subunit [Candidatus Baltobacteraceae bacterium]